MAISPNTVNDRIPGKGPEDNPTDTAKQNYTELGWLSLIHISEPTRPY